MSTKKPDKANQKSNRDELLVIARWAIIGVVICATVLPSESVSVEAKNQLGELKFHSEK